MSEPRSPLDHALVISRPSASHNHRAPAGALAGLLISLDPRFTPGRVVLIYDQSDARYAQGVESLLSALNVEVIRWEISLDHIEATTHKLALALSEWGAPLPLCIGSESVELTTLVSSVFLERRCPLLQTRGRSLYRLGARSVRTRLEPQIDLRSALSHLGARVTEGWEGVWFEHHLRDLSHDLIDMAQESVEPLEVIQRLARETASGSLFSPHIKGLEVAIPKFQEVLDHFERAGCLELTQGRLRFSSDRHRAYCSGGWLSLYIQDQLTAFRGRLEVHSALQDLHIELAYPNPLETSVPLTVAMGDHLCFFFCVNSESDQLDHHLRSAEVLIKYFGASVLFTSVDTLPPAALERARLIGVPVCIGDQLKDLSGWLSQVLGQD